MLLIFVLLFVCNSVKSDLFVDENVIPELNYMDLSVDPCDDFYRYTCGNFKKIHPKPESASIVDHFALLEDQLIVIGNEILSTPKRSEEPVSLRKAKAAYKACMNTEFLDEFADQRIVQDFGSIPLVNPQNPTTFTWNDIGDLAGEWGISILFDYIVGQMNPTDAYIVLLRDPLLNPAMVRPKSAKSYEEITEEGFWESPNQPKTETLAPFDIFLRSAAMTLLRTTGNLRTEDEVIKDLDDMSTFMRQLYAGGIVDDELLPLREPPITLKELQDWTEAQFKGDVQMNWVEYLGRIFGRGGVEITENTKLVHLSLEGIYGVLNLVRKTDPKIVKNFAMLRIFLFQAPDSDEDTRNDFETYYKSKNYTLYPRWEYCTRKILDVTDTASLDFAVAYDYHRHYFNPNQFEKAMDMVRNIQDSFEQILEFSDWLDEDARSAALKKAEKMMVLLAYPDLVEHQRTLDEFYENVAICDWDNYRNSRNIRAFKKAYQLSQLNVKRDFWDKSTFIVNAYYNRPNNKIFIPISILNPVFFYGNNTLLDYSRLGSIVGHEITHGFDSAGQKYNEDGLQLPWWSNYTLTIFEEKAECFKEQYSKYYVPEVDSYLNGSNSINENLADNGGVRESFKAFAKLAKRDNIQSSSKKYSLEQLFFIGYSTMWCSEESESYLRSLVSSADTYPPNRFRVIGALSNMEEFAEAFKCPKDSFMNPTNKCVLW